MNEEEKKDLESSLEVVSKIVSLIEAQEKTHDEKRVLLSLVACVYGLRLIGYES